MINQPLRVLIADDESPARQRMRNLLGAFPNIEIAGEARDGNEVLAICREDDINAVFLDIQMPGLTGLDVADHLRHSKLAVVFVSAYGEHALEAFDLEACDYLTKPVRPGRLEQALDRVRNAVFSANTGTATSQDDKPLAGKISIPVGKRNLIIEERSIVFATVYEGSMELWTTEKQYFLAWTLKQLEDVLTQRALFFKVNRQTLINLDFLKSVEYSTSTLTMVNGSRLDISRSATKKLRELI